MSDPREVSQFYTTSSTNDGPIRDDKSQEEEERGKKSTFVHKDDENLKKDYGRRSTHGIQGRNLRHLTKRFNEAPSPLKVGRVLTFFSHELGFADDKTDVTWRKDFGWPETEEEWALANEGYISDENVTVSLQHQLKSLKATAQANLRKRERQLSQSRSSHHPSFMPAEVENPLSMPQKFKSFFQATAAIMDLLHQNTPEARSYRVAPKSPPKYTVINETTRLSRPLPTSPPRRETISPEASSKALTYTRMSLRPQSVNEVARMSRVPPSSVKREPISPEAAEEARIYKRMSIRPQSKPIRSQEVRKLKSFSIDRDRKQSIPK